MSRHNHPTRGILEPGKCPACDAYHARQKPIVQHPFTEDINDGSMCVCGVPALVHEAVVGT